ncbi:PHP domain-containing protein [Thalassotalea sp. M1531]|uniref:PHP domain-containing protein n=1 Tax=Thalassotalea algicola TaxID=2716224 RepID=A0A7Y0Q8H7_9GAMM|nr:PHP domain-containing protein [Thalassotalea algicola]NMP33483.1 PHP domain-containing protein [Thalassotalea algicola]
MSIADFDFNLSTRCDFHTHTNLSDGKLKPEQLIDRAVNFQVQALAITDHDTVAAFDSANRYILEQSYKLTLISGIELSTLWQNFEIHIVGLNIDIEHPALLALIAKQQQAREARALMMNEKLAKCGFDSMLSKAKALAGEGSITRAHFARVLHDEGHVSTMQAAFDKYIGKGKRAFVKPQWCDIEAAVSAIHQAGGTAIIAHPMRYDMTSKWLRRLILDFKEVGGDGMEIVLPQMNPEQRRLMLTFCLEYDLYASLGSDFHYPSKWSDLGRNLSLPEQVKPIWQLWQ